MQCSLLQFCCSVKSSVNRPTALAMCSFSSHAFSRAVRCCTSSAMGSTSSPKATLSAGVIKKKSITTSDSESSTVQRFHTAETAKPPQPDSVILPKHAIASSTVAPNKSDRERSPIAVRIVPTRPLVFVGSTIQSPNMGKQLSAIAASSRSGGSRFDGAKSLTPPRIGSTIESPRTVALSGRGAKPTTQSPPKSGPSQSRWLMSYPWYEGPTPPLGYAFYNTKWQSDGLPEPIYAISKDGPKRKRRFVAVVYAVFMLEMFFMAGLVASHDWTTRPDNTRALNYGKRVRFLIASVWIIAVIMFGALFGSNLRRRRIVQIVVVVIYFLLTLVFSYGIVKGIRYGDPNDQRRSLMPFDVWIGMIQCGVGFLLVLVFISQRRVEVVSWTGLAIVALLQTVIGCGCFLIYFYLRTDELMAGFKMSVVCLSIAVWSQLDLYRLTQDKRTATVESEQGFAIFQLQVDYLYLPWYGWELTRRAWRFGLNKIFGQNKKRRWVSAELATPKTAKAPVAPSKTNTKFGPRFQPL